MAPGCTILLLSGGGMDRAVASRSGGAGWIPEQRGLYFHDNNAVVHCFHLSLIYLRLSDLGFDLLSISPECSRGLCAKSRYTYSGMSS